MNAPQNQYGIGLDKTPANYVALTPLSFLARTAAVYPDHTSAVYEGRSFTWSQTYARCRRFASYLAGRGIGNGDTVAAMLPNIPAMNELHFAVPMAGAVLNALNIRLDAASIAFQLDHGGAKIILVDPEFSGVIAEALTLMKGARPFVIDVDDASFAGVLPLIEKDSIKLEILAAGVETKNPARAKQLRAAIPAAAVTPVPP